MFAEIFKQCPVSILTLTWALPTAVLLYCLVTYTLVSFRIRRSGCVRAPVLASNPFSAIRHFIISGRMQAQNQLLEYFDWIFYAATPECPNIVEMALARKRFMMTREPEHVKTVLTGKFGNFGKGEQFHEVWSPFLGDSIFTTDGQQWQNNRALIRPMFIKDRIRDIEIFNRWSDVLLSKLPPSGQTVDICDLLYRMTLDVTTDYLLGQSVGSLYNPNGEFIKAFTEVQRMQMLMTILAPFRSFIPKGKYKRGIRVLERFIQPFIDQTLALTRGELDKLAKSDKEFTFLHNIALFSRDPKLIRDQLLAVLLAGRDTTAATLSWTIYELSNYPDIYQKLRRVVLDRVGREGIPTYEDLKEMTYLTHTLNETLRLYPAVPFNIRACVQDTTLPGGPGQPDIAVFKDDVVIWSALCIQRRQGLYPPASPGFADPAVFSPDRWDHWTPKAWDYTPFNGGPRICVGQNFAMTEMAFLLVRLLQKYERIEYRADWKAQFLKVDIVGCPGQGVPIALYEAEK